MSMAQALLAAANKEKEKDAALVAPPKQPSSSGGMAGALLMAANKEKQKDAAPATGGFGGALLAAASMEKEKDAAIARGDDPPPAPPESGAADPNAPRGWNKLKYHVNVADADHEGIEATQSSANKQDAMMRVAALGFKEATYKEEQYDLSDDVYTMVFLAPVWSSAFFFAFSTFTLKMCLYMFLAVDIAAEGLIEFDAKPESNLVRLAQFFILPVAVGIQDDLMNCFASIANIKYDEHILLHAPGATSTKWSLSIFLRLLDGMASTGINFVLLLQAEDVLSLFLNFAALQFLQDIDNVGFALADKGYLTEHIEEIAKSAQELTLPKKQSSFMNKLDSAGFLVTYLIMLASWIFVTVDNYDPDTAW